MALNKQWLIFIIYLFLTAYTPTYIFIVRNYEHNMFSFKKNMEIFVLLKCFFFIYFFIVQLKAFWFLLKIIIMGGCKICVHEYIFFISLLRNFKCTMGGRINPLFARWGNGWKANMSSLSSQEDILYGQVISLWLIKDTIYETKFWLPG